MTTQVSSQQNPTQASNSTSQQTLSYAASAKKAVSSPPIATSSSTPSPAVAVGGSAPVQHGKSNSVSPVNGRTSISPAVPVVSAPAIAHSSAANGADHSRKSSVTISANGPSSFNPSGGPVGGKNTSIQFGSMADSPRASHSSPQISQSNASAPVPIPGRVSSPPKSPSPIPQYQSGGVRSSTLAPNSGPALAFGSLDGGERSPNRQPSIPQGPNTPSTQAGHLRRESSHSAQNDQSAGRGGHPPQGGRGRGAYNGQNSYVPQNGFAPTAPPFRTPQNAGRGSMAPAFQPGRPIGNPSFQGSPNLANRSPHMQGAVPNTPNMNQAMPMQNQQYGYYPHAMQGPQVTIPYSSNLQRASDFSNTNEGGKAENWMEKRSSKNQRSSELSNKLSNQSSFNEPLLTEHDSYGQSMVKKDLTLAAPLANGSDLESQQSVQSLSSGSPETQATSPDQTDLPPLPTPIPSSTPSAPVTTFGRLFMDVADVARLDISPAGGGFEQFLTLRQQPPYGYPPQAYNDPRGYSMNGAAPMMFPQMQNMGYGMGPPQSPQPGYNQPYVSGQYGPQAQPMSRNSSQMSEHRPASSTGMGQPGTPHMTPANAQHHHTPSKPSPAATSFSKPPRKSAAILIKRPDGEVIDTEHLKAPASPLPKERIGTPPVASTPTPPPKSATPQHNRTDSGAVKSQEQIKQELLDKVKASKAAAGEAVDTDKAAEIQAKADEEAKAAAEAKAKEDEKAKEAKAAEDAKAREAEEKAAAEKKAREEEEALEREIAEMEAREAAEEKRVQELLAKRAAEKAIADKEAAEKKKITDAENDRLLKEQEREMERLEDEKEAKRLAAAQGDAKPEVKTIKAESKDTAPTTPSTLASKLSNLTLGADSRASTPGSDDSMGPPPRVPAEKRGKPAALNLAPLNTKPVEPPQPSAALQSLKSARFLTVMNSELYPQGISSPNPALNSAVKAKGKSFKYDKEFLLQFQKVFVEKPSLEFESQIKALIGDPSDGGSARSASTRSGAGMGPRGSNRAPGAFAMGSFGAGGIGAGGKTLPPGTTSAQRFAMANNSMPRPVMPQMNSFNRNAFEGGNPMARTPSMGNHMPQSPRQGSRTQRGSKRDNFQPNAKQEAQAAKTMPLTAGMELKPIQTSATGWKPRSVGISQSATGAAGPAPGASSGIPGHMEPEMVQRKVKAALNKMTPEKFDKIADQILAIAQQSKDEADGRTLRQVIQLTFEKATDEAHWASMYAKFCKRMLETMNPEIKDESIHDKNGNVVSGGNLFRKYLLNRCQEEFERGWKVDLPEKPEGERGEEKSEEAAMLSDEYYIAAAAKRRGLGLVQFIGELYKLSMLTERIMHECVRKLVDYTGIPDEAEIESLTKLLKTIGLNLDSTEKGKPMMDVYFTRIQGMIDTPELPSRLKFMLMDIVDLRKKNWQSKETNKGPKTLDEVRLEAEAAAAQKASENARGNQRGGGGGGGGSGRMQMGRGDSRNFSNQFGGQQPVDYNKNTVGMDDLRRLTNKGGANRNSSQPMSFGPTSMFSSRSNSGRKMVPGGSLSRAGDDSGLSSRTGTPPQQKEKESATSANAFSLLAGLDAEHPASPPSTANSPELSKATPASAGKPEGKKESEQ
ncbi:hypothetical protein B0O99DRAFT_513255 [Bisporella sp. PMI_857]|nr:hypothetical protein B0O99DRAFT_513255 [Bisporella sp. PMI_857]